MVGAFVGLGERPVGPRHPPVGVRAFTTDPVVDGEHERRQRGRAVVVLGRVTTERFLVRRDHFVGVTQPVRALAERVVVGRLELFTGAVQVVGGPPLAIGEGCTRPVALVHHQHY